MLGDAHPDTVVIAGKLGSLLLLGGQDSLAEEVLGEAEPLLRRAWEWSCSHA